MNRYKIFLASSAELEEDKILLEIFVSKKNREWFSKGIFLELITWRDFIDAMSKERLQNEYNEAIKRSDIFIVLFHTCIGQYTEEEFETAYKAFVNTGKPLIFTYFKSDSDNDQIEKNPQIEYFKEKLNSLGHFYSFYKNNDDLNYKYDLQLDKLLNNGIIKTSTVDWKRYRNYAVYFILIPLILLYSAFKLFYTSQPFAMNVTLNEINSIPNLPFEKGKIVIKYGDKREEKEITKEAIFSQIPGKFKGESVNLLFSSNGYETIDTILKMDENLVIPIKRDNSLGVIIGNVTDDKNNPIGDAVISILNLSTSTDAAGNFELTIPFEIQAEALKLTIQKNGFRTDSYIVHPSKTEVIPFQLSKIR